MPPVVLSSENGGRKTAIVTLQMGLDRRDNRWFKMATFTIFKKYINCLINLKFSKYQLDESMYNPEFL